MKFIDVMQNNNVYGDGIHDDTKALQACIAEVKDGGTVYFPDGTSKEYESATKAGKEIKVCRNKLNKDGYDIIISRSGNRYKTVDKFYAYFLL